MACLDHVCLDCGYEWADNNAHPTCPNCQSDHVRSFFDEGPDLDELDYREDVEDEG